MIPNYCLKNIAARGNFSTMTGVEKKILLSTLVGDALGSGVDGFTRGHIHAHYRDLVGYIDPGPALKGRLEHWRKPGLYSSISQFMLILSMACARRGPCIEFFSRCVADSPEITGYGPGIFRHPDGVEKNFISRMKDGREKPEAPATPSVRIIPALIPLSFRYNSLIEHISDVTAYVRLFTRDMPTLASALLFSTLLRALVRGDSTAFDPVGKSLETSTALADAVESNSASIFSMAANPGALIQEIQNLVKILSEINAAGTLQTAEQIICSSINKKLKTPVTRATVNIPEALVPFSLAVCSYRRGDPSLLFHAAAEGGSAAALAALCGAITACSRESSMPENLVANLVNRRKILSLVDTLHENTAAAGLVDDFMKSEASLTVKEQEELRARLKHGRNRPGKKQPTRSEKEKKLACHVVESCTKLYKAKCNKDKKRHEKKREE
jgi:ADP-ribosylglycohydrolase